MARSGNAPRHVVVARRFEKIGVQPPVADVLQSLEAALRIADGIVAAVRPADDNALQHLEAMTVGTQQVLEKRNSVVGHGGPPSPSAHFRTLCGTIVDVPRHPWVRLRA